MDIKALTSRRAGLKSSLTRFEKFINESQIESITELELRLEKIESLWSEFDSVQAQIEEASDEFQVRIQESECDNFETKYFVIVARAKQIISQFQDKNSVSVQSVPSITDQFNVKLPQIQLPEFSGEYDKWLQFYNRFNALIHTNPNLTNIQRFYYLQGALKGEAGDVLASLETSDANYIIAWDLLRERYENKKIIINSHLKGLFELQSLTKENPTALRKFTDEFKKHFRSLEALKQPVAHWGTILIYMLTAKLDFYSKREWETVSKDIDEPTIVDFTKFLTDRCKLLESVANTNQPINHITNKQPYKRTNNSKTFAVQSNDQRSSCVQCKGDHPIYGCKQFTDLSIEGRLEEAKKLKLCTNCLRPGHTNSNCYSGSCKKCGKKHNSLLHREDNQHIQTQGITNATHDSTVVTHCTQENTVLLSTAIINIEDSCGKLVSCRALLDSGSQSNFITSELVTKLKLKTSDINLPVSGINESKININKTAKTKISSRNSNYQTTVTFLIIQNITNNIPNRSFNRNLLSIPKNIKLADPKFHQSQKIDILIGAGIFYELISPQQRKLGVNKPILQGTQLGWIISGPLRIGDTQKTLNFLSISKQIERFWEIEQYQDKKPMSESELNCEEHFVRNTQQDSTGRFVVKLPTKENIQKLGESRDNAIKRFHAVERKLSKDSDLKREYIHFMQEYETLGHMSKANPVTNKLVNYLPHHGIIKHTSTTTKLRVVFDASAKTSSNLSLNDVLQIGPVIQDDLFSIILRFRKHNVVILADIAKMYRQINIHEDDRDLQRIFWRENTEHKLQEYRLNTITYGTGPASFLATRCLHEVANQHKTIYPNASNIIKRDFYVDDLLTGSDNVTHVLQLKNEIELILSKVGFELRKWTSNDPQVRETISQSNSTLFQYMISENKTLKTLGIAWNPDTDNFYYDNSVHETQYTKITKRIILSLISQIFDPLGLIGPIIIHAKIILQALWLLNLSWDESVPTDLATKWSKYYRDLKRIENVSIPRHVLVKQSLNIELHGFCDASEAAYGACVYLKSTNISQTEIHLLCAKARVAPIKTISLPRLELCGAVLLTKLVDKVVRSMDIEIKHIYYWCDSTIVLHWLSAEPNTWKTFVAHRVADIQGKTERSQWRHVMSADNPADIISRGSEPSALMQSSLWWHGPSWLKGDKSSWPKQITEKCIEIPESKPKTISLLITSELSLFQKFSTFSKLIKVTAIIFRFIHNMKYPNQRLLGTLSNEELDNATNALIKCVQREHFAQEIHDLNEGRFVCSTSKLGSLNPFIDKNGLLCVGGRISNANLTYYHKHPILLPSKHRFTELLIINEHRKNLHAGSQALLACIRQKYWPLNAKNTIRSVLRKCLVCFRVKPRYLYPQMGNLPVNRVSPDNVFASCGVDYAGPYLIKDGKLRNRRLIKSYICIFVCYSTKAAHIELVSDLSSEGFLNALKRFVSRRGLCRDIFCDNGTNFVGANNELVKIVEMHKDGKINTYCTENRVKFHFIPARSPHFGGLWEAAVKSTKYHLDRIMRNVNLNYEEFNTLLNQVEAVMNSRPICPLSNDPNDLEALTPGHFLIGRPLNTITQTNDESIPWNHLNRYHHLQQMYQHFWSRWCQEYLHTLHQRNKWRQTTPNIGVGTLVLLKEENTPPLSWALGRVEMIHPGRDGIVRVISVKTKNGLVKRSVTKVCSLPIDYK